MDNGRRDPGAGAPHQRRSVGSTTQGRRQHSIQVNPIQRLPRPAGHGLPSGGEGGIVVTALDPPLHVVRAQTMTQQKNTGSQERTRSGATLTEEGACHPEPWVSQRIREQREWKGRQEEGGDSTRGSSSDPAWEADD